MYIHICMYIYEPPFYDLSEEPRGEPKVEVSRCIIVCLCKYVYLYIYRYIYNIIHVCIYIYMYMYVYIYIPFTTYPKSRAVGPKLKLVGLLSCACIYIYTCIICII